MATLTIISSRIASTTAAFTEFATPVGPPLVDRPFWADTTATMAPKMIAFSSARIMSVGCRERREGRNEATRGSILEVHVKHVACKESDEAHHSGECDADHDCGGKTRNHQTADHRYAHHLHCVGLFAHRSRTQIGGDRRPD